MGLLKELDVRDNLTVIVDLSWLVYKNFLLSQSFQLLLRNIQDIILGL